MPPRKRAAAAAKPEPLGEQEGPEAPAVEETSEADGVKDAKPSAAAPTDVDLPCTVCFPDGWPDGVTARGCEHGSWTRT
ncbi:hypothetical protein ACWDBO_31585 [Streptomyces mirabilis]